VATIAPMWSPPVTTSGSSDESSRAHWKGLGTAT
jgi:hypothetical protein